MTPSDPPRPLALPVIPGANRMMMLEALHRPSRSTPGRTWVQLALVDPENRDGSGFTMGAMFPIEAN